MPPELLAITPPTVAMSVLAGSGPSLRPCAGEQPVGMTEHCAGLDPGERAALLHRDAAEVAAHVDQDAVASGPGR